MKIHRDNRRRVHSLLGGRAIVAVSIVFAWVGCTRSAAAQDVRAFQLRDIGGFVQVGFLADLEDRSRSESDDSNFDRLEFSQILNLDLDAYIYHPRFLTVQGGVQFESIEGIADNGGTRLLFGGDWRFNFLQEYRDSISIYGNVQQREIARPFAETYDLTTQLYGVTLYHRWGWLPFDVSYQHRSTLGGIDDGLDDTADEVDFRGDYNFAERSSGRVNYNVIFRDIRGDNSRRQTVGLSNTSYFGDESERKLSTFLSMEERNDFNQMYRVFGNTYFAWQHTENLSTRYLLTGRWEETGDQSLTSVNPSFVIRHQLYESLTTQLELFGRFEDASFASTDEFGGQFSGQYVKQLADFGRLSIGVTPRVALTSTRPDQETAFVTDESHVMVDAEPVLLQRQDIFVSSIVVTNTDGTIEFDPGPAGDYIIIQTDGGFETELVRTLLSNIGDGETVLVDYEYELIEESDILTVGVSTHVNLWLFQHLGVSGRYETSDQNILSGDRSDLRINSYDRYVAGLQLSWPWINAKAEYENYDATFGPFEGFLTSLSVFTYGKLSWQARANAGYSLRNQRDSDETITRLTFGLGGQKRLFRSGLWEIDGSYLRERWTGDSSDANDIDSYVLKSAYSWWYGKTQVKLEGRMAQLLREAEDRRVYQVNLELRRDF